MQALPLRGADLVVRTLAEAGVDTIFTLSGNHIMPIFDACVGAGIRLIHTRHEAAAVHMADAWARITGRVGIALVTGGPGHANAVGALYTAAQAESPLLLLSGHAPLAQLGRGAFQEMRQADLAAPLAKASWTVQTAEGLAADLARAFTIAQAGRPGPVHLSLPNDLLDAVLTLPAPLAPSAFVPTCEAPDRGAMAAIVARLRGAARPVIVTGPTLLTRSGRALADRLEAATGIPVVGMESPRGLADPCLGAFADALGRADCVLLLGKRLDFTLKFGQAPGIHAEASVLHIDADEEELARSKQAFGARLVHAAVADAVSATHALIGAANDGLVDGPQATTLDPTLREHVRGDWCAAVRAAVAYRPAAWATATSARPGRLHPAAAFRPLQAWLDSHPDAVLVADGGEIGQWAQACLSAPHRVINGIAGAIGAALPFAAAAQLALPGAPVVAVLGDGTFGFHSAEFDTAVRYALPFIAVVGNDARWNAEYQIQLRDYGPARTLGCELLPTRYDLVAAAFGGHGAQVTDPAAMAGALREAVASGLPACLNVMIEGLPAPTVTRPA